MILKVRTAYTTSVANAAMAKLQSSRTTITTIARTSSMNVGPRLKIRLRIRKSVERAPRSMIRDRVPVCLVWWKSSDSESAWPKLSTAARAMVDCDTRVKIASRA